MKIDIFPHIMPEKYKEAVLNLGTASMHLKKTIIDSTPMIHDLDLRFRLMDRYEGLVQVLTLTSPPLEEIADERKSVELAKIANDEIAALVAGYPDRFVAGVAALPMNNFDAALDEADRAVRQLGLKGVQIFTPVCEKPLDAPEFDGLFRKMAEFDLPVWLHPTRGEDYPDYRSEDKSFHSISGIFGWPYETTVAMTRLVFSGLFERYPNLRIITHHCGAMIPFFEQRLVAMYEKMEKIRGRDPRIKEEPIDYFRKFYADTALYGGTAALTCGYAFFGAERILFGTDMPLGDGEGGARNTGKTIEAIEGMNIGSREKEMIYEGNARALLRLP